MPNDLEKLMLDAAENPDKRDAFFKELLGAELFILSEGSPEEEGEWESEEGDELAIVQHELEDGSLFIPVFTSLDELQDTVPDEAMYSVLPGQALIELLKGSMIIINPANDASVQLDEDAVEYLLSLT